MQKKKLVNLAGVAMLLAGSACVNAPLWAKPVDAKKAQQVAEVHLGVPPQSNLRSSSGGGLVLKNTVRTPLGKQQSGLRSSAADSEIVGYYVFAFDDRPGFVIVSGDDVATPVLGYSNEGGYDKKILRLRLSPGCRGVPWKLHTP